MEFYYWDCYKKVILKRIIIITIIMIILLLLFLQSFSFVLTSFFVQDHGFFNEPIYKLCPYRGYVIEVVINFI